MLWSQSSSRLDQGPMTSRDLDPLVPTGDGATRSCRLCSLTLPFDTNYVKTWHPTRTSWLLFGFYSQHPLWFGMLSIA